MRIPEVIKVRCKHKPGSLASVLNVIARADLSMEGLRPLGRDFQCSDWELTIETEDVSRIASILADIDKLPNASLLGRSDRVFDEHEGGKIVMVSHNKIDNVRKLRDIYTPGVARVCLAIQDNPTLVDRYTNRQNTVGIVTNGTAVLGLGNIGPVAGLPVMEGKAALLSELAGLSGVPILIDSTDPDVIVNAVTAIAPSFGAIQLEDIRSPECFEIEARLTEELDIPILNDDRRGTAVVALAALLSVADRVDLNLHEAKVGQIGLGAAGLGICELLLEYGVADVIGADIDNAAIKRFESLGGHTVDLNTVMSDADVVIATSGKKGLISPEMIRKGQVVFALSNPEPEIDPQVALDHGAAFAADGQVVNNLLGFPGIFKGVLEARASKINSAMLIAAAQAIRNYGGDKVLVPDPLDLDVHQAVAKAVRRVAQPSYG